MSENKQQNLIMLAATVFVLFAAWFGTVSHLASLVWTIDIYSHGVWIPCISCWLIWRDRDRLEPTTFEFWWPAAVGLFMMNVVWLLGGAAEARIIQHVAFIGALQFLVAGCLGPAAFRQLLFPMLFLFLAIPVGQQLVEPLQVITARTVVWALGVTGVPFQADGVMIELSSGVYQVARACAGVKFLYSSLVMGILLCYLAFSSWRRRMVMLIAAVLVPVLFNAIRVYGTLLIAEMTDSAFAKGVDHVVYGWGFLSAVLIILIAGAYRFADRQDAYASDVMEAESGLSGRGRGAAFFFGLSALMPFLVASWVPAPASSQLSCEVQAYQRPECTDCTIRMLSSSTGGHEVSTWNADESAAWQYRINANVVVGISSLYLPDRAGHRLVHPISHQLAPGWARLDGQPTKHIKIGPHSFGEYVIWRGKERRLVWRSYAVNRRFIAEDWRAKLALGSLRLSGRQAIGQSVVVVTDFTSTIEDSRAILRTFMTTFQPEAFLWRLDDGGPDGDLCAE